MTIDVDDVIESLERAATVSRAEFNKLPRTRWLLYVKNNLPKKLAESYIESYAYDMDEILAAIELDDDDMSRVGSLSDEDFDRFCVACVNAFANLIRVHLAADIPINWRHYHLN